MKKLYIILILILIVVILFIAGKSNKTEAPTVNESGGVSNNMPVVGEEGTPEMIVEGVKEFIVTGKNFSFDPEVIKVNKGDKVRIVFKNTQGFHDFVIEEYGAATKKTQAPTEEVIEFVADKVGSFEYYCSVGSHRQMGMKGTLEVTS